jgi:tRNA threonylcarbamoyladenosine biosynthesis protein TsaE
MQTTFVSRSEDETFEFGKALAQTLGVPARVLLVGDLGAGKTTLTRGLAVGFGVSDPAEVSSPTFTLVNRYDGRIPVYHVDLYRIGSNEVHTLGLDEILEDSGVVAIVEWADRMDDAEVAGACRILLTYVDPETRRIEVAATA